MIFVEITDINLNCLQKNTSLFQKLGIYIQNKILLFFRQPNV